jgi:outer membrane protein assembly factor BamA
LPLARVPLEDTRLLRSLNGRRGMGAHATSLAWVRHVTGPLGLALVLLLVAGVHSAAAIEELEAEEDIAELLPTKFPVGERPRTVEARPWVVLPQFGYGPDTGPLVGAKFAHRDLFDTGTSLDLAGTYALNQQQYVNLSIGSPHLENDRLVLLLRAKYSLEPQRYFFGLGNNDIGPDPISTNLFQEIGGALTVGWRPFERVAFNFGIGIRKVDIRRGTRRDDTPFTPDRFPLLPGVHGGNVNPIELSLVWNTRDDVMRPTHGWRLILKVIHSNHTLASDFEFTRYVIDAGYLRAFNEGRQIVGVRVNGEWVDGPSSQVPYWELAELGGSDTLRGFYPHRFLGKGRVLVNTEFRSRITEFDFYQMWHVRLDGVLFGDAGRVFISNEDLKDQFHINTNIINKIFDNFQYSYGAGLRITMSDAIVARIDVGFSDEWTGLVYLSFGHTF